MKTPLSRRSKFWISFIAVIAVIFIGLLLVRWHLINKYCSVDSREIRFPGSDSYVIVSETMCDGFGASDVVSVLVQTGNASPFNRDKAFFVYNPSSFSGPLKLNWVDAKSLDVAIDRVEFVQKKLSNVDGISVQYHIGNIGEPVLGVNRRK